MTSTDAARATARGIHDLPAQFMADRATYRRGGELGFEGIDFYFAGRGGVLGDVPDDVVTAALVFFHPDTVGTSWRKSAGVLPRVESARQFAACAHAWAEAHLADGVDWSRLAELAGRVVTGVSPAGAPLFAGWRLLDEPASPKALCLHRLNALRELRAAYHGGAVLAAGLRPVDAFAVRSPRMAALSGWSDLPDPEPLRGRWQQAEDATDAAMTIPLGTLDERSLYEFTDLLAEALGAVT